MQTLDKPTTTSLKSILGAIATLTPTRVFRCSTFRGLEYTAAEWLLAIAGGRVQDDNKYTYCSSNGGTIKAENKLVFYSPTCSECKQANRKIYKQPDGNLCSSCIGIANTAY